MLLANTAFYYKLFFTYSLVDYKLSCWVIAKCHL